MAARAMVLSFRSSSAPDTAAGMPTRVADPGATTTDLFRPAAIAAAPERRVHVATIQNLGDGELLLHPLYISVEGKEDEFIATSVDLALVGQGESELEAIDDLREQVLELYRSLSESRDKLGPFMIDQLGFLERLADRRR